MTNSFNPITEEEKEEILEWEYLRDLMEEPFEEPIQPTKPKEYIKFDDSGDYIDCPYFWQEVRQPYWD